MKLKRIRKRSTYLIISLAIVLGLWTITDPDFGLLKNLPFGSGLIGMIVTIVTSFLGIGILHITRKAMHDYPVADFRRLGERAFQTPIGAGLFAIALALMTMAFAMIISAVLRT